MRKYVSYGLWALGFSNLSVNAQSNLENSLYIDRDFQRSTEELQLNPVESDKEPQLVLPPLAPEPPAQNKELASPPPLSATAQLFVAAIRIDGNTVLPEEAIQRLITPYLNRRVGIGELHELRYKLSRQYFDLGYMSSGVLLPDQKVNQGIVRFQVIEGELDEIRISGTERLSKDYINQRIQQQLSSPLNIKELQDALRLLQQNSRIRQIQAQLEPGNKPGEAILDLRVEEARAYALNLNLDNHRSPSIGARHATISFEHNNLLGWGDELFLSHGHSQGLRETFLNYTLPISADDAYLSMSYFMGDAEIVERDFEEVGIDIDSESEHISLSYTHPIINRLHRNIALLFGVDKRHSAITVLEQPDFFLGAVGGETNTTSLRLGAEWIERSSQQVIALRGIYRQGFDMLDATINSQDIPDGEYRALIGQFQYARLIKIGKLSGEWHINGAFQRAIDPLLSLEKFAVGGSHSVRGYRENQWVRDNGLYINLEYHLPLFQDAFGQSKYHLKLIPFFDYGRSWDEKIAPIPGVTGLVDDDAEKIRSIGLGFDWRPENWFNAQLFYGYALDAVPEPSEEKLQDNGFHFSIRVGWPGN